MRYAKLFYGTDLIGWRARRSVLAEKRRKREGPRNAIDPEGREFLLCLWFSLCEQALPAGLVVELGERGRGGVGEGTRIVAVEAHGVRHGAAACLVEYGSGLGRRSELCRVCYPVPIVGDTMI